MKKQGEIYAARAASLKLKRKLGPQNEERSQLHSMVISEFGAGRTAVYISPVQDPLLVSAYLCTQSNMVFQTETQRDTSVIRKIISSSLNPP